jgi:hypothetical protein
MAKPDKRSHKVDKDVVADVRDLEKDARHVEQKVADVYDDDVGSERSIGGLPEANDDDH